MNRQAIDPQVARLDAQVKAMGEELTRLKQDGEEMQRAVLALRKVLCPLVGQVTELFDSPLGIVETATDYLQSVRKYFEENGVTDGAGKTTQD